MYRTVAFLLPLVIAVAACTGDAGDDAFATLPPIRTTTTTSTTTTTISEERQFYVIKRGETLSIIAASFGVTVQSIVELNNIADPNNVPAGATIEIPRGILVIADLPEQQAGTTEGG